VTLEASSESAEPKGVIGVNVRNRRPVVVGIDGSGDSERAVSYGVWEAERRRAPLLLVHAYIPPAVFGVFVLPYEDPDSRTQAQNLVDDAVDRTRNRSGLDVHGTAVLGYPADILIQRSLTAGMTVVGSRGLGGFDGMLTGSVSSRVATYAKGSVVVVRQRPAAGDEPDEGQEPGTGPVIVGVDGSLPSDAAIGFAIEEASLREVPLDVYYVWDIPAVGNRSRRAGRPDLLAKAQGEADRMLTEVIHGWREKYPDVEIRPHAIRGQNPLGTLIDESSAAGLVVVGSRGRGGFTGLLLGSISDGLMRHAHSPVAVVHARGVH
jgi:nucleotide-binding universal stress UspA family protein